MDFTTLFVQQLINGVSLGSIYALIALGYTMIYGIIKLINFAHGDIYMVGAYVGFFSITMMHVGVFPALIISMVVTAVLGIIVERCAYKPLRHAPRLSVLITAIGVSFFLEYTMMYFVSPTPRTFPAVFESQGITIGNFVVNGQQILIFSITIVLMALLTYIVQKTKIGKAVKATSENIETAGLLGINTSRIITFTVMLASSLGAAAGVLVGLSFNAIEPTMGMTMGFKGLAVLIMGGLGNIRGAMMGGFILGIAEVFSVAYGASSYRDAVAFGIIILILFFRPEGLFSKAGKGGRP